MTPAATPAVATGVRWNDSGLEPLPWFPFTVAMSDGNGAAAAAIARAAERAYWSLARVHGIRPRFTLFILDRDDWPAWAALPAFGVPHRIGDDAIVVGADHDGRAEAAVGTELAHLFEQQAAQTTQAPAFQPRMEQ
jgi:hypothetical protein